MYASFNNVYAFGTCFPRFKLSCKSMIIFKRRRVKYRKKYQAIAVTRPNFVSLPPCFKDRHGVVEPFSEFLTHPSVYDWIDGAVTVRHEQGRKLEIFEVVRNLQSRSH